MRTTQFRAARILPLALALFVFTAAWFVIRSGMTTGTRPPLARAAATAPATRAHTTRPNVFEPRRARATAASPFDWRTGSVAGSSLFLPNIMVTKSATPVATMGAGGDVNGNGFVNPGDTLMYSV